MDSLELDNPGTDYAVAWWAFTPLAGLAGDYNGDTVVDAVDYAVWREAFGDTVSPGTGPDGNGNGMIDAADFTIWRDNFGGMSSTVVNAPVPEPSSAIILTIILGFAWSNRSKAAQLP